MGYTIKQVSERTNLSAHVLRYYEKEGLLFNINRSTSGIRSYTEDDLEWLGLICCLKNTGMSLIQEMNKHLEKVSHKINHYTKQYHEYNHDASHQNSET